MLMLVLGFNSKLNLISTKLSSSFKIVRKKKVIFQLSSLFLCPAGIFNYLVV